MKDFIIAVKKAYCEIYAEKIKAKKEIKLTKKLMFEWYNRADEIKLVEDILNKHWLYLPKEQRQDYIQKTLDLIHYGFDIDNNHSICAYGLDKIYKHIYNTIFNNYEEMKQLYKKHNYEIIHIRYKNLLININEILIKYSILEENEDDK